MSKCKVCGTRLAEGVMKCPVCGAVAGSTVPGKISPTAGLQRKTCPFCGKTVLGEHNYCPNCETSLKKTTEKKEVLSQSVSDIVPPEAKERKFSNKRNKKNKEDSDCPNRTSQNSASNIEVEDVDTFGNFKSVNDISHSKNSESDVQAQEDKSLDRFDAWYDSYDGSERVLFWVWFFAHIIACVTFMCAFSPDMVGSSFPIACFVYLVITFFWESYGGGFRRILKKKSRKIDVLIPIIDIILFIIGVILWIVL